MATEKTAKKVAVKRTPTPKQYAVSFTAAEIDALHDLIDAVIVDREMPMHDLADEYCCGDRKQLAHLILAFEKIEDADMQRVRDMRRA